MYSREKLTIKGRASRRVFPPKNALRTKRPVFYSPGEFTGRKSETHLHKRKVEINEKTDQKTGRWRILKMVVVRGLWTNFSLHLKTANFSSLKRITNLSSRKILLLNPCRASFLIPCTQIKMCAISRTLSFLLIEGLWVRLRGASAKLSCIILFHWAIYKLSKNKIRR